MACFLHFIDILLFQKIDLSMVVLLMNYHSLTLAKHILKSFWLLNGLAVIAVLHLGYRRLPRRLSLDAS